MKKAKIFLTGLAVLAVVGGALAFKAKQQFWYGSCDLASNPHVCTLSSFQSFATTKGGIFDANFDVYGNACPNGVCRTKTMQSI
jgi:hypothetical protein